MTDQQATTPARELAKSAKRGYYTAMCKETPLELHNNTQHTTTHNHGQPSSYTPVSSPEIPSHSLTITISNRPHRWHTS